MNQSTLEEAYKQVLINEGFFDRMKAGGSGIGAGIKTGVKNIGAGLKAGANAIAGNQAAAQKNLQGVKSVGQAYNKAAGQSLMSGGLDDIMNMAANTTKQINAMLARINEITKDQGKMQATIQTAGRGSINTLKGLQTDLNQALQKIQTLQMAKTRSK